jgi:hypothetical protein
VYIRIPTLFQRLNQQFQRFKTVEIIDYHRDAGGIHNLRERQLFPYEQGKGVNPRFDYLYYIHQRSPVPPQRLQSTLPVPPHTEQSDI